eukprot:1178187-Prorocentrum_minimum.AAC.3
MRQTMYPHYVLYSLIRVGVVVGVVVGVEALWASSLDQTTPCTPPVTPLRCSPRGCRGLCWTPHDPVLTPCTPPLYPLPGQHWAGPGGVPLGAARVYAGLLRAQGTVAGGAGLSARHRPRGGGWPQRARGAAGH